MLLLPFAILLWVLLNDWLRQIILNIPILEK